MLYRSLVPSKKTASKLISESRW